MTIAERVLRRFKEAATVPYTPEGIVRFATQLAHAVHGSLPKHIQGGHRWSDRNESAKFTTNSPEGVTVVCVVSVFQDGSMALAYFSDDSLSGTATFENITHDTYDHADVHQMVQDIHQVWKWVDEYKASWEEGQQGDE